MAATVPSWNPHSSSGKKVLGPPFTDGKKSAGGETTCLHPTVGIVWWEGAENPLISFSGPGVSI